MTNDEIKKLDWQILTARLAMENNAYLKMIIENHITIISELKKIPEDEVTEQMNKYIKENKLNIEQRMKKEIPEYK